MILIDAGPLVALVDGDDQHHAASIQTLKTIREPLATVWPAISEAMYLLSDLPRAQEVIWDVLSSERIRLISIGLHDVPRMRELMAKYSSLPMDFADAALVRVAERDGIRKIFTVDKTDFKIYRLHGRRPFTVIP